MTPRDESYVAVLSHKVRVLRVDQAAHAWWDGDLLSAGRRLRILYQRGHVDLFIALFRPLPSATSPVCCWKPSASTPDFGAISYRLRSRWTEPLRPTLVSVATHAGAARVGGHGGRRPRASELSHDIGLADVFLFFARNHPSRAKGWQSESALYEQGFGHLDRLPDAMVVTRSEKTVIEFGGAYTKPKLQEFHASCAANGLAYEIW